MIARRTLLLGSLASPILIAAGIARAEAVKTAVAAPAGASLPVPAGGRLSFRIIRKGSVIGEHSLNFTPAGDSLTVSVAVNINVGLGPISLFRYTHKAIERWQGGKVVAVDAHTDDDGSNLQMTARRQASGLRVSGSEAPGYTAPPHALPATHWNLSMLDGPLINTQNGKLMQPVVKMVGLERVAVGSGSVEAQHYQLRGDADLDTWYDLTRTWAALRFTAKDGSEIRYERV